MLARMYILLMLVEEVVLLVNNLVHAGFSEPIMAKKLTSLKEMQSKSLQ